MTRCSRRKRGRPSAPRWHPCKRTRGGTRRRSLLRRTLDSRSPPAPSRAPADSHHPRSNNRACKRRHSRGPRRRSIARRQHHTAQLLHYPRHTTSLLRTAPVAPSLRCRYFPLGRGRSHSANCTHNNNNTDGGSISHQHAQTLIRRCKQTSMLKPRRVLLVMLHQSRPPKRSPLMPFPLKPLHAQPVTQRMPPRLPLKPRGLKRLKRC